jgi:hypothetical protein
LLTTDEKDTNGHLEVKKRLGPQLLASRKATKLKSDQDELLFRYLYVLLDSVKISFLVLSVYLRVPINMVKVKNSVFHKFNLRPY